MSLSRVKKSLTKIENGPRGGKIDIFLTDDREIKKLKGRYLGIWRSTDVIAFPALSPGEKRFLKRDEHCKLGEVIISLDAARRQAAQRNVPLGWELTLLALHGCLHLRGFHDTSVAGYKKMRKEEFETMVRILPI
jgi:probable rRNA maturation factor